MSSTVASISWMNFTQKHNSKTVILFIDRNAWRNKDFGFLNISTFHSGASFVDHLCYFCLVFVMYSCASVY